MLRRLTRLAVIVEAGVSIPQVCWLLWATVRNKVVLRRAVSKLLSLLLSLALIGVNRCESSGACGHAKLHGLSVGVRVLLNPLSSIDAGHRLLVVEAELLNRLLLRIVPTVGGLNLIRRCWLA